MEKITFEKAMDIAKNYTCLADLRRDHLGIYQKGMRLKWFDKFDWISKPFKITDEWDYKSDLKPYHSLKDLRDRNLKLYNRLYYKFTGTKTMSDIAKEMGWVKESKCVWTKDKCIEFCKNFKTVKEVRMSNYTVYTKCSHNKWFNEMPWILK